MPNKKGGKLRNDYLRGGKGGGGGGLQNRVREVDFKDPH